MPLFNDGGRYSFKTDGPSEYGRTPPEAVHARVTILLSPSSCLRAGWNCISASSTAVRNARNLFNRSAEEDKLSTPSTMPDDLRAIMYCNSAVLSTVSANDLQTCLIAFRKIFSLNLMETRVVVKAYAQLTERHLIRSATSQARKMKT